MVFNSYIFIIYFLPITLAGWYMINRISNRGAEVFLLGMSLLFYGYFNPYYLILLIASIAVNYGFSRGILRGAGKRLLLVLGLMFNIALILYFKYFDFFVTNLNAVFQTDFTLMHILLPLGISFFTFQQISFLVDSYHGEGREYDFLEYAVFVAFFPQLVAGPIVLHSEFVPQLCNRENRSFSWNNLSWGVRYFVNGLFKKMMVADVCGSYVDWGFENNSAISSFELLLVMICYTAQIYFDFSGYSDMAIGIGRMLGFKLPDNFHSPYRSTSICEFWERWHMTLTRFLRKYIYIPLGGNRRGVARQYLNILIVFLISGLWHGANWTFVIWGGAHGALSVAERAFDRWIGRVPRWLRWIGTYLAVSVLWLLFRADSIAQWWNMMTRMVRVTGGEASVYVGTWLCRISYRLAGHLPIVPSGAVVYEAILTGYVLLLIAVCLFGQNMSERKIEQCRSMQAIGYALVAVMLVFSLGAETEFIYFNF